MPADRFEVELTRDAALPRSVSLTQILRPLMTVAAERSAAGDPQAESRALIAVVAFYVNGKGLAATEAQRSEVVVAMRDQDRLVGPDGQ